MGFKLGSRSKASLVGVHPLLAACAVLVITKELKKYDAMIFEGVRTEARQRHNVQIKVSWTMHSEHLPGRALDIVPYIEGAPRWSGQRVGGLFDQKLQYKVDEAFKEINRAMKRAAKKLGIKVENLYDLIGKDKPHWQIDADWDIRRLKHVLCEI